MCIYIYIYICIYIYIYIHTYNTLGERKLPRSRAKIPCPGSFQRTCRSAAFKCRRRVITIIIISSIIIILTMIIILYIIATITRHATSA